MFVFIIGGSKMCRFTNTDRLFEMYDECNRTYFDRRCLLLLVLVAP